MHNLSLVDVLHDLTPERFFSFHFGGRPFVIKHQISHWPAAQCWNFKYLKRHCGDANILVEQYDPESDLPFLDQTLRSIHKQLPLGHYLDTLECSDRNYAIREDTTLFKRFPKLLEDVAHFSPFCSETRPAARSYRALWIGPANYVTGLHSDPGDTLLFQIYGRKRVVLFAPSETRWLYEESDEKLDQKFKRENLESNFALNELKVLRYDVKWSDVQPFQVDIRRFPLFLQARCLEALMCPGDTLYIPDRWWHAVLALEPTISISVEPAFDGRFFTGVCS